MGIPTMAEERGDEVEEALITDDKLLFKETAFTNENIESGKPDELIDSAFNNMLMAWYQSGYATGYYVAQQEFLQSKLTDNSST